MVNCAQPCIAFTSSDAQPCVAKESSRAQPYTHGYNYVSVSWMFELTHLLGLFLLCTCVLLMLRYAYKCGDTLKHDCDQGSKIKSDQRLSSDFQSLFSI